MNWSMRFLGVGNAEARALGSAAAVLESDGLPVLLIDCGPGTLARYREIYGRDPEALYITHTHSDHIGDLESLFYRCAFDPALRGRVRVYVPVDVIALLHRKVAELGNWLAEGGANYWDVLQLVVVGDRFWHAGWQFESVEVRHHAPRWCFGLRLPGSFVYTSDTRPIPEVLRHVANAGETVFHDVALHANPSHSGVEELEREYPESLRLRMWLYHYASDTDAEILRTRGWQVATANTPIKLPDPLPAASAAASAKWAAGEGR